MRLPGGELTGIIKKDQRLKCLPAKLHLFIGNDSKFDLFNK